MRWQWGLAIGSVVAVAGLAGAPWGAWLPLGAYVVGTALWGWSDTGRANCRTRDDLKAVSLAVGWRGAAGLAVGFVVLRGLRPDGVDIPWGSALAIAGLVGLVGTFTLTALTLVGLDAARSSSEAPSP